MRKREVVKSRFRVAMIGSAAVAIFLIFNWAFHVGSSGGLLHTIFAYGCLSLIILPAMQISVGLFCEERRNQTLELLYLAGMNSRELFIGKLLGGILAASSDLLAIVPLMAIPFFSGGISIDLFVATVVCFPMLLLFVVSVGALASALCEDDGAAWACAYGFLAAICLATPLPYYLGQAATGTAPFASDWLSLSPGFAPYLVVTKSAGYNVAAFWRTEGITALWTALMLLLAAMVLNRNWRQGIARCKVVGEHNLRERLIHGSSRWRANLRERLLPTHAFQWLVEQDRRPVVTAWALIAGVLALWFLGWLIWPGVWPTPTNFYITALILVAGVEMIATYSAARRIGFDRRDGCLELLLTTPLTPGEMVDDQAAAIVSQFKWPRRVLLGLCIAMMVVGFFTRSWTRAAMASYIVIWFVIGCFCLHGMAEGKYRAMWIALNSGRPAFALTHRRTQGGWWKSWYWIYWMTNLRSIFRGLGHAGSFPTGSPAEVVIVCLGGFVMFIILAATREQTPEIRPKLIADMRVIACEPVPDANDPRFKKWDTRNRL